MSLLWHNNHMFWNYQYIKLNFYDHQMTINDFWQTWPDYCQKFDSAWPVHDPCVTPPDWRWLVSNFSFLLSVTYHLQFGDICYCCKYSIPDVSWFVLGKTSLLNGWAISFPRSSSSHLLMRSKSMWLKIEVGCLSCTCGMGPREYLSMGFCTMLQPMRGSMHPAATCPLIDNGFFWGVGPCVLGCSVWASGWCLLGVCGLVAWVYLGKACADRLGCYACYLWTLCCNVISMYVAYLCYL